MTNETLIQIIIAIFSGVNLITTMKIAILMGEYKRQVDINTKEIERLTSIYFL